MGENKDNFKDHTIDINDTNEYNFIDIPSDIKLLLGQSIGKGRGVFANQNIKAYQLIHISPVLLFPQSEDYKANSHVNKDINEEKEILSHYTYTWGTSQALALGLGSMFNHTRRNNVGFILDKKNMLIKYITLKDIEIGAELCINYGTKVWFDDADDINDEVCNDVITDQIDDNSSSDNDNLNPFLKMEL